ncbi:MAG: hypothetical protein ACYC2T_13710 [Bacillota bacterium]
MPTINLQDKIFGTLEEHELQTFLSACDSSNLGYIQRDENSWQLLPQLPDTTLVIKPLEASPVLHSLIQNLNQQLTWHGALVIVEPGLKPNIDLFKVMRAQIAISFIDHGLYPDHYDMYFYSSLRAKSESIDFIDRLVKQLSKKKNNLTYTLASYWKHLTYFKYRKIIFSQVPTVLVVFTNIEALEKFMNDVTDCLLNSIIDIYGKKISRDELDKLAECIALATINNPTTIPDAETPAQKEAPTECAPNNVIEATEIPVEKTEATITVIESIETPKPNTVSKEANPEHETIMPLNVTPQNIKNSKINSSAPLKVERAYKNAPKTSRKSPAKPHTTSIKLNAPKPHYGKVNPLIPPGDGVVNYFTRPSGPVRPPQYNLNNMKRSTLAAQLLNMQRYQLSDFSNRLTGKKMTISLFNSPAEKNISNLNNTPNRNTTAVRSTFYQPPTRPKEQKQENPVQINEEKPVSIEEKTQHANFEALKALEIVLES